MFISAGKFKGRRLDYPKNRLFRPTKSIVREAVFNMIGANIKGASFLDLCSGSGAVGFEAESQGASQIMCVDKDITYLKKNQRLLDSKIRIIRSQVTRYVTSYENSNDEAFDFIYLDPVWADHDVYNACLSAIFVDQNKIMSHGGRLFVEHDQFWNVPEAFESMKIKTTIYGNSRLSVFSNSRV